VISRKRDYDNIIEAVFWDHMPDFALESDAVRVEIEKNTEE
jgi:hypothetical protein